LRYTSLKIPRKAGLIASHISVLNEIGKNSITYHMTGNLQQIISYTGSLFLYTMNKVNSFVSFKMYVVYAYMLLISVKKDDIKSLECDV
jgi:hypothetical protein